MTDRTCPGRCNAPARRAQAAYDTSLTAWQAAEQTAADWRRLARIEGLAGPEPPRWDQPEPPAIRPWPGEPVWCSSCTASLRRCLAELEELLDLRVHMTDGYQTAGEQNTGRVHGTKQRTISPAPGIDDLDDIIRWLASWETDLREKQGWPATPYRGINAPAVTSALAWLGQRLNLVLCHPDMAEDFGLELLREHDRLQRLTSTRPPMHHKPLPCPRCMHRSLWLHDDETVRCHNAGRPEQGIKECRKIMTRQEYADLEDEASAQVAS